MNVTRAYAQREGMETPPVPNCRMLSMGLQPKAAETFSNQDDSCSNGVQAHSLSRLDIFRALMNRV